MCLRCGNEKQSEDTPKGVKRTYKVQIGEGFSLLFFVFDTNRETGYMSILYTENRVVKKN